MKEVQHKIRVWREAWLGDTSCDADATGGWAGDTAGDSDPAAEDGAVGEEAGGGDAMAGDMAADATGDPAGDVPPAGSRWATSSRFRSQRRQLGEDAKDRKVDSSCLGDDTQNVNHLCSFGCFSKHLVK